MKKTGKSSSGSWKKRNEEHKVVEFRWYRRCKDRTPIISDLDIIRFTEEVIKDYRPSLLETPGKLDPYHFIERYLRATVDYQDLYYGRGESPIAGATIFNRDRVAVFDRYKYSVKTILVEPNTIILDNSVTDAKHFGFEEFTAMHEAGHYQLHPEVYRRSDDQINLYDMGLDEPNTNPNGILCKRSSIGHSGQLITSEDFREHQANTYSASMLMPRRTFIPYVYEQNKLDGYSQGIHVIMPSYDRQGDERLKYLIKRVSLLYGVSVTAVRVNMRKYGLLTPAAEFEDARRKLAKYARW